MSEYKIIEFKLRGDTWYQVKKDYKFIEKDYISQVSSEGHPIYIVSSGYNEPITQPTKFITIKEAELFIARDKEKYYQVQEKVIKVL